MKRELIVILVVVVACWAIPTGLHAQTGLGVSLGPQVSFYEGMDPNTGEATDELALGAGARLAALKVVHHHLFVRVELGTSGYIIPKNEYSVEEFDQQSGETVDQDVTMVTKHYGWSAGGNINWMASKRFFFIFGADLQHQMLRFEGHGWREGGIEEFVMPYGGIGYRLSDVVHLESRFRYHEDYQRISLDFVYYPLMHLGY